MFTPFVIPFVLGVAALFAVCLVKYVRWYKGFTPEQRAAVRQNLLTGQSLLALKESIEECLLHHRVFKKNLVLGYMHSSIALGWFLLIVVGGVEARLETTGPVPVWEAIFLRYFVHNPEAVYPHAHVFAHLMDSLLLVVLSGVCIAFIKSLYHKIVGMKRVTRHTLFDLIAKYTLWFIFPLRLLAESLTAALWGNGGWLTGAIGSLFTAETAAALEYPAWLLYSLSLGAFFTAMPFTRYMHIFTEVPLIFFRRLGVKEAEQATGYTLYELSACSRCGICIDNCPLNKELGHTDVQPVYFLRDVRNRRSRLLTAEDCLLCGRCQAECPVGIDLLSIRRQERRRDALDRHGNYDTLKKALPFNAIGRVGYFGGCMSHLTPGITESMKKIFEAAGVKYWHMDAQGTLCCGRPLFQQGFVHQAEDLRARNTEMIRQSGVKMLVTSCPICYQSFTKEYHLDGVQVMHHSQYLQMLIDQGRLKPQRGTERIVYHDPCELGRGCGIYNPPRAVIASAATLLKTPQEREKSLCCGHNPGDTLLSFEQQARIREASAANLLSVKPDLIATACPMCKKALSNGSERRVKDIAEIIAEHL